MSWARRVPASASRHLLLLVVALVAATGMLTYPGTRPRSAPPPRA